MPPDCHMAYDTDIQATAFSEPIPIALAETAEKQVEIGAEVEALFEHPGWEHLRGGLAVYQRMLCSHLMGISGSSEASKYAALTGEMAGMAKVEAIAQGIVRVGEEAKAQTREAQIEEES